MDLNEVREWAAKEFGAHSHKEGQILAALGPIEEWLGHLARHGVHMEVVPKGEGTKEGEVEALPLPSAPIVEVPLSLPSSSPLPDPATFVQEGSSWKESPE